jgi:hypothetical protein
MTELRTFFELVKMNKAMKVAVERHSGESRARSDALARSGI